VEEEALKNLWTKPIIEMARETIKNSKRLKEEIEQQPSSMMKITRR